MYRQYIYWFLSLPTCALSTEFCENRLSSFSIILLTNKLTSLRRWKHNLLGEGNKWCCYTKKSWRHICALHGCQPCRSLTSCRRASATICLRPCPPSVGAEVPHAAEPTAINIAVRSDSQYLPTPTAAGAWRHNTAVSKAAWWPWSLTFWPWKWCPSHMWLSVSILVFLSLSVLDLGPMYATDRRQTDTRQTSDSIIA